jgi:hypothetical protein
MLGELFPNRAAYAGFTYSAILDGFILETGISVKRRFYQSYDVADRYFRRIPGQNVSAVGTSHAFHYVALAKLLKELFKEQERDAFSLRDRSKGHRSLGSLIRVIISVAEALEYYHVSASSADLPTKPIPTHFNELFRQFADLSLLRHHITQYSWYWNINQLRC